MSIKQDSHSYLVTTNKDDSILIPHAINPTAKVTLEKVMNSKHHLIFVWGKVHFKFC